MMAESVNDVATVQRGLQRTLQSTEDELAAQARLTRDLQDDLLRTRMVEFESMSERLYRLVRQAAKETAKQVRLDIVGGAIEIDRGVLDRMTGAFEHLLRNNVTHGVESPAARAAAGKDPTGSIVITITQEGNEVSVEFRDDGAGLNLPRIREKGRAMGLIAAGASPSDAELANLIFTPGFSTADAVTGLAGRGVGMDVVRADVNAMGGRIETATAAGRGTSFRLVLPLTTAVTQVVMLRCGELKVAVPSTLVEIVKRSPQSELADGLRDQCVPHRRPQPAVLLARRAAAGQCAWPARQARAAGGDHSQRGAAHRAARRRSAGQPGSGGQEPGAATGAPAGSGRHDAAAFRRAGADLQPGGAGHVVRRIGVGDDARSDRHARRAGGPGVRRSASAAGAGGRRLAHGASRHATPAAARRVSRHVGQGRSGRPREAGRRASCGVAVGHRNAAHGRLRPGAQPASRPEAGAICR